jgi:primase-polymerase (primpol)-like protein
VWRWEERRRKWSKPLYQPNGAYAKTDDPATWVSFQIALAAFETGQFDGIGFVLTSDGPFAMADLDHCFDSGGSSVSAWVSEIVDRLDSYTEVTPSGEGLRVIVKAKLPRGGRKRGMESNGGVELYDCLRYMTVTGNHFAGTPETIEERQNEIAEVHRNLFENTPKRVRARTERGRAITMLTNDLLLVKARAAKNGRKFSSLYDHGDISAYASASEADLALCGILAFWTGADAQRIDKLFRGSELFRKDKWDVQHRADGKTYGEVTVAIAVEGTRESYGANIGYMNKRTPSQYESGDGESSQRRAATTVIREQREMHDDEGMKLKGAIRSGSERSLASPKKWPPGTEGAYPNGRRWKADENGDAKPLSKSEI